MRLLWRAFLHLFRHEWIVDVQLGQGQQARWRHGHWICDLCGARIVQP